MCFRHAETMDFAVRSGMGFIDDDFEAGGYVIIQSVITISKTSSSPPCSLKGS